LKKTRALTTLAILIIVPIGFASKFYNGLFTEWVNNSLGGVFYEIFWCLVIFLILPKITTYLIPIFVFLVTSVLEFTQLLSYPILETIRSNFLGRTLIGTSFEWSDFIYYFIGSFLGFLLLQFIKNISSRNSDKGF